LTNKPVPSLPINSDFNLFENIPVVRVIETYPQLIDYDTKMYDYLREQAHICKFDFNLTYPQTGGNLPYTPFTKGQKVPQLNSRALSPSEDFMAEWHERWMALPEEMERSRSRRKWMRETLGEDEDVVGDAKSKPASSSSVLASKSKSKKSSKTSKTTTATTAAPNKFPGIPPFNTTLTGEMNSFWGCDLLDTVTVYALNLTYPWSTSLSLFLFISAFDVHVLTSSPRSTRAHLRPI
jgi:carboxypeptidase D